MARLVFTPQFIKSATCPTGKKKQDHFDSECKNLLLEVRNSGGKTYYLRYRTEHGKTKQIKLADTNDVTLTQARSLADRHRNQIVMGEDPLDLKAALKTVPTLSAFIHEKYLPYVKTYKRSWKCDAGLLRNHIEPIWGKRHLDQISKLDIIGLMAKQHETHKPGSCNRLLILLRYLFNLALRWEVAGVKKNPTEGVPLMEENNKMERFLTEAEAATLYGELLQSENTMLRYIVPMLFLTGARKREVLDAKWEDFDLERNAWRIPLSKSGKHRHVPLSDGAVAMLNTMPRNAVSPWPFANPATGKPYVSVYNSWNTARKAAGLPKVRMHDLRHSFASFLVNAGRSLYEVQKILGHTQIKTTQRYAHLSQGSLLAAANAASHCMPLQALGTHPSAESDSTAVRAA